MPVSETTSQFGGVITFTFSNAMLRQFQSRPKSLEKQYQAAVKYGFRGFSAGEKNGIFLQRPRDSKLTRRTNGLVTRFQDEVLERLDVAASDLDGLRRVKIVSHDPTGNRVVGLYNTGNGRMVFLGVASY